jgi:uncharacterized membrane protein YgdD (TMEM256/DUF423 family)
MPASTFHLSKSAVALGAALALVAVFAGALGSHPIEHELEARGNLDSWRIGVRYAMWHGLALVAWAAARESLHAPLGGRLVLGCFVLGSVLFSGSIFALCFDVAPGLMGPLTPMGGVLLMVGWIAVMIAALRARPA